MRQLRVKTLLAGIIFGIVLSACTGLKTFPNRVGVGETAVVAAGWKHRFSVNNITVTITPDSGPVVVYSPNDPAIRGIVNLYPDPVSSLIVSPKVDFDLTSSARTYNYQIGLNSTGFDSDWWETTVYFDLPDTIATGPAVVTITTPEGESVTSEIMVVSSVSDTQDVFDTQEVGPLIPEQIASLGRVDNYVVDFIGSTVPYAIQLTVTHFTPFMHVINPRGDIKNVTWSTNGDITNIIIMPANGQTMARVSDFKIYLVADFGIPELVTLDVQSIEAFDIDGNDITVSSGIGASLEFHKGINWIDISG